MAPNLPFLLKSKWNTPCFSRLNEQPWPCGFGVQTHGVRIGVRASVPGVLPVLRDRLPTHVKPFDGTTFDAILSVREGGSRPGSRIRDFHLAYHNHSCIARSHRFDDVLGRFDAYFALAIAFLAPRHVFIHAGAVEWQGRAIVVPGQSTAGKSTLILELVKAGARYLSDEFAVLDRRGRVHPWPKPIAMRTQPGVPQHDVDVSSIGTARRRGGVAPGLVVMTEWKEGAHWRPRWLGGGMAMLGMMENAVAGRLTPRRVTDALMAHAGDAQTVSSPRGEAAELAPRLLEMVDNLPFLAEAGRKGARDRRISGVA